MKKITLACAAGASTSMLVMKMREAAKVEGYECEVNAMPVTELSVGAQDSDVVLLGPQVRFQLAKVRGVVSCPVEAIDAMSYGTMDGKKVLTQAKGLIGE